MKQTDLSIVSQMEFWKSSHAGGIMMIDKREPGEAAMQLRLSCSKEIEQC